MYRRIVLLSVLISGVSMTAAAAAGLNSSSLPGDEFLKVNQNKCFVERNIGSCLKFKVGKILHKLATNKLGYFSSENTRNLADTRTIRFVHLASTSDVLLMDTNSREFKDDNEPTKIMKFLQRTAETFARNHGFQIEISSDGGTKISTEQSDDVESRARVSRGEKKKKKWLIILPLIILMKIAHLKMTVVPLLLATLGLNVILIGGGSWLVHYLKYKTLCKIHPHYIQTQSHVYDSSDPSEYSSFLGSSDIYSTGNGAGYGQHEQSNWNTRKNFHAYRG